MRLSPFLPPSLRALWPLAALSLVACGRHDQHASELAGAASPTPSSTPVEAPPDLDRASYTYPLSLDEPWITAETTLLALTDETDDGGLFLYLAHTGGEAQAGGFDLPPDDYLKIEVQLAARGTQLRGFDERYGHTLEVDFDVLPPRGDLPPELVGYLIVDGKGEVWVRLRPATDDD